MSRFALRPLAVALALVPLGFSGLVFMGTFLWGVGLRCDDHCDANPTDWRRAQDAWQWDVVPVLGGIAVICGLALVVCVWHARRGGALAALALGTVAVLAAGTWLVPGWHEHLDREPQAVLVCLLVLAAGLCASLLARRNPNENV